MEMITSGRDGSTSATGFVGVILSLVCIVMAVSIFVFYFVNTAQAENILKLLDKVIIMLGISSALLGTRKISGVIGSKNSTDTIQQAVENVLDKRNEAEEKMRRKIEAKYSNFEPNSEDPVND
jgi:cadmium resistance protein CadD (predicted permease)